MEVADELDVAGVFWSVGHGPLQRRKGLVEDFNGIFAVAAHSLFFRQAAAAIFERRVHRRADVVIVGQLRRIGKEAGRQQPPGLDGHRRELRLSTENVANGENVLDRRPLVGRVHDFAADNERRWCERGTEGENKRDQL